MARRLVPVGVEPQQCEALRRGPRQRLLDRPADQMKAFLADSPWREGSSARLPRLRRSGSKSSGQALPHLAPRPPRPAGPAGQPPKCRPPSAWSCPRRCRRGRCRARLPRGPGASGSWPSPTRRARHRTPRTPVEPRDGGSSGRPRRARKAGPRRSSCRAMRARRSGGRAGSRWRRAGRRASSSGRGGATAQKSAKGSHLAGRLAPGQRSYRQRMAWRCASEPAAVEVAPGAPAAAASRASGIDTIRRVPTLTKLMSAVVQA